MPDPARRHRNGALCYPLGAAFGPVPLLLVFLLSKDGHTKRCAAQAACSCAVLTASAMVSLVVMVGGVAAQLVIHGPASLDAPSPPPLLIATSIGGGLFIVALYVVQIVLGIAWALRARRGEVVLLPGIGKHLARALRLEG